MNGKEAQVDIAMVMWLCWYWIDVLSQESKLGFYPTNLVAKSLQIGKGITLANIRLSSLLKLEELEVT